MFLAKNTISHEFNLFQNLLTHIYFQVPGGSISTFFNLTILLTLIMLCKAKRIYITVMGAAANRSLLNLSVSETNGN